MLFVLLLRSEIDLFLGDDFVTVRVQTNLALYHYKYRFIGKQINRRTPKIACCWCVDRTEIVHKAYYTAIYILTEQRWRRKKKKLQSKRSNVINNRRVISLSGCRCLPAPVRFIWCRFPRLVSLLACCSCVLAARYRLTRYRFSVLFSFAPLPLRL